jgi:tetratricopeptide (TPR) repeat protein
MKKNFLYLLLSYFVITFGIFSQAINITPKEIYQILSREDLITLQNLETKDPNQIEEKISKSNRFLEEYFSQFPDDRRTEAERKRAGEFLDPKSGEVTRVYKEFSGKNPGRLTVNSVRLLKGESSGLPSSASLIKDSNIFYILYSNLGFLYSKKGESDKAISSFLASLQYHDFSQTEEIIFREIDSKEHYSPERIEKIKSHKATLEEKNKKENEIDVKIDEFHLNAANAARAGKPLPDERAFKNNLEQEKKNLEILKEKYKNSLNSLFLEVQKEKGSYDSKVIKELSLLIKNKELQDRITNRLKDPYPIINPDKENGFIGYFQLMEIASRINPYDADIFKFLGDEFKATGKIQKAIDSYLRYLELKDLEKKYDGEVSLSLAGLYSSGKNYIRAIDYYEKYLSSNPEKQKSDYLFITGDLIVKRLGDYERASQYFGQWLELTKNSTFLDNEKIQEMQYIKKQMIIEFYLAKYYKINSKRDEEDEYLTKAYQSYTRAKEIFEKFSESIENQKNVKDTLKKKALTSADPLLGESMKTESDKLESMITLLKSLRTEVNSLPSIDLLFQIAERSEDRRDYAKSINFYREIQEIGTPNDREIALKNILRIERIKMDGINRERVKR